MLKIVDTFTPPHQKIVGEAMRGPETGQIAPPVSLPACRLRTNTLPPRMSKWLVRGQAELIATEI